MDIINYWESFVMQPFQTILTQLMSFIPNLIRVAFIIVIGWIIAKLFQFIISRFLKDIQFDALVEKIGIAETIKQDHSAVKIAGLVTYWLIMIAVIVMALNELQMEGVSYVLKDIMNYFVTVVKVIVILILGMFLSMTCSNIVFLIAKKNNIPGPQIQAGIVRKGIIFFTFVIFFFVVNLRTSNLRSEISLDSNANAHHSCAFVGFCA
jgi:hypothetical protein